MARDMEVKKPDESTVERIEKHPELGVLLHIKGFEKPLKGFPLTSVIDMLDVAKSFINPMIQSLGTTFGKYLMSLENLDPYTRDLHRAFTEVAEAIFPRDPTTLTPEESARLTFEEGQRIAMRRRVEAMRNVLVLGLSNDTSWRWVAQLVQSRQDPSKIKLDESDEYWIRQKIFWDGEKLVELAQKGFNNPKSDSSGESVKKEE